MRETVNTPLAIFSVDLEGLTESELTQRHSAIESLLTNESIQYNIGKGCYKGNTEKCYIISAGNFAKVEEAIFGGFNQESVLLTDIIGAATLKFANGDIEPQGYFTEVQDVSGLDAYTRYGSRFYACIGAESAAA